MKRAFTMVELLAVLFIIAMLLAIGTPSALRYRAQIRASATQTIINQIDGAIGMFYVEHGAYPEMHPAGKDDLLECLTGYRPADKTPGNEHVPFGYADKEGDGNDGYGYRMQRRGRVYGPWNNCDKLDLIDVRFRDAYGAAIEYYPFRADRTYNGAVNTYAKDPDDHYYRRDFVLRSKGENGEFETYPHSYDDVIPDDITNLFD